MKSGNLIESEDCVKSEEYKKLNSKREVNCVNLISAFMLYVLELIYECIS